MDTHTLEWEAVLERLSRLERANRRWRVVAAASLLVMMLALLMGATAQKVPDEIRARAFVIVASDGRSLGRLGTSPDGSPELVLYDPKGIERAILFLSQGADPMLHLRNEDNTLRATIRVDHITLDTKSARGLVTSATMTSDSLGSPGILLRKPDGDAILSFVWGGPHLALRYGGKQRAEVGLGLDGSPEITLSDEAGKRRAILGRTSLEEIPTGTVSMRPESSLVLLDKDGKVLWKAP